MRCLSCGTLSFRVLCKTCLGLIAPKGTCRDLQGFKVYGFFDYDSVSWLLHAKYFVVGSRVYTELSTLALGYLKTHLQTPYDAYAVGVDDRVKRGYAHNAIFLRHLRGIGLKPMYQTLYARNPVCYAGKTLEFRQKNPRDFLLKRPVYGKQIVLVDDLVTSGLTLLEAKEVLERNGAQVLHAFVLADAGK